MVSEATRGIKFVIKTELDPNVSKPFEALEAHVDALEKRLAGLKIPAPVAARITGGAAPSGGSNGNPGTNGANGAATGGMPAGAQADLQKQADAQKVFRRHLSDIRREADERDRIQAEKTAKLIEKANQESLDQQIKDLKKAQAEREKIAQKDLADQQKAQSQRDKIAAKNVEDQRKQFEKEKKVDEAFWKDFENYGEKVGADRRAREKKEKEEAAKQKRVAESEEREAQEKLKEGIDATIESVSKLARGFAQLGMIGETDLHRITDTMLGVQGTIDTVRGSIDTIKQVRGFIAARRAAKGAHAAGHLAHAATTVASAAGGVAASGGAAATGTAAVGTAGTAAAGGVAGLAAANPVGVTVGSIAAIIGSVLAIIPTIGGMRRWGFMGGFHEGSPGQKLGTNLVETGASFNNMIFGALGRAEYSAFAPYGLTNRQRERRSEEFIERNFGEGTAFDKTDVFEINRLGRSNARTERLSKEYREDYERREQMRLRREAIDAEEEPLKAQVNQSERRRREEEFEIRSGRIRSHAQIHAGELSQAFGRQREAFGEQLTLQQQEALGNFVDPAKRARAAADQAREEGEVTRLAARQQENLRLQLMAHRQRGGELQREFSEANQRYNAADSESRRKTAFAERVAIQEQINQHAREEQQIRDKIRQVSVDGAERQLALQQQSLATAKQTADTLRQQRQTAAERFGQLLPGQQRAVLSAARQAASGGPITRRQASLLRQYPELTAGYLRKRDVELAEKGGFSELAKITGFDKQLGAAEANEKQAIQVAVSNRQHISAELHTNVDETARELMSAIVPLLKQAHEALKEEVEKQIQAQNYELAARDRGQARAAAGE